MQKEKNYEEAIQDHDKAIKLNPKFASAYNNRGIVKTDLGRHEEAIKDFDKAIEINPKYTIAYNNRGFAKAKLEQYREAIKDYDKAIKINLSGAAETYYNKGISYLCLSKWEDAKADLTTAKNKGADIVALFQKEFKSVSDFEKKFNVTLPDGIKALLE